MKKNKNRVKSLRVWLHKSTPIWHLILELSMYAFGAGFVYGFLYMVCLL